MKAKNLKRNEGTWEWMIGDRYYKTNCEGRGVWEWKHCNVYKVVRLNGVESYKPGYEWKQIIGTGQFRLSGMSISGARKKINRFFREI